MVEKNKLPGIAYVAGNEHFYAMITYAGTNETKIHLAFLDEPVTSTEVEISDYSPLRAALARTGSWRFTSSTMWFDVNEDKRECVVYQVGDESIMPGWGLFARTPHSEEIILLSDDGSSMMFAQDETDSVDFSADPVEDFHVVSGSRESKEKAEKLGLTTAASEAGGLPVFRIDSEEDAALLGNIFYEPDPYETNDLKKCLQQYLLV